MTKKITYTLCVAFALFSWGARAVENSRVLVLSKSQNTRCERCRRDPQTQKMVCVPVDPKECKR